MPPIHLQIALNELTGVIFNKTHLKALSVLYKGLPVAVIRDGGTFYLTLQNITLVLYPSALTTRVLINRLPISHHRALKRQAAATNTSVNKIILQLISSNIHELDADDPAE